ncbi:MAG: restriction endonuclease [Candidatus Thorarchaeota archaeon]
MTESNGQRLTLKEWLAAHARTEPVHYRKIAEALGRDAASVSASLSIERKQAEEDNRPPYFVRIGPGLYQYNGLYEGAADEDLIREVRSRAEEFNLATRRDMRQRIANLGIHGFEELAKVILLNIRARVEKSEVVRRYNNTIVMTTSWRDDGGRSPVVVYAKKCRIDEKIDRDTILEIRGALPTFKANQGVLISNGVVTPDGKNEALGYAGTDVKVSVPPVHLMDIEICLNVLLESRTGVRERKVEVLIPDDEFWERLSSEE